MTAAAILAIAAVVTVGLLAGMIIASHAATPKRRRMRRWTP